jgi:hypothetical protein
MFSLWSSSILLVDICLIPLLGLFSQQSFRGVGIMLAVHAVYGAADVVLLSVLLYTYMYHWR